MRGIYVIEKLLFILIKIMDLSIRKITYIDYTNNVFEIKLYNYKLKIILYHLRLPISFKYLKVTLVNDLYANISNNAIIIYKRIKFFNRYYQKYIYYKLNHYKLNSREKIMPQWGECNNIFWAFIIRKYYKPLKKIYLYNNNYKKFNGMSFYKCIIFAV